MLNKCHQLGMELNFVDRIKFKQAKRQSGLHTIDQKATWVIPEGGANPEGILGCTEIYTEAVAQNNEQHFDAVFIAQGTTTTSLGILVSIPSITKLFVVPVLKGFDARSEMKTLAALANKNACTQQLSYPFEQVEVLDTHHQGGYAKITPELSDFIQTFNTTQQFPIEPTYTAKALMALQAKLPELKGKKVLFIHTGGLKG